MFWVMMMMARFFIIAALLGVLPVAQASIQVGFSPEGSARGLVLNTIDGAQRSIDMMAYSFQAKDIVDALIRAQKRGVKVRAVIDKRRNQGEGYCPGARKRYRRSHRRPLSHSAR